MDLALINTDPLTNQIMFGMQSTPLSGINLLIQLVVSTLLTTPDSDVIDPTSGGGLEQLIGKYNVDATDLSEIQPEISRILSTVRDEIIGNQVGLDIPVEEKLSKLTLVSITAGADPDTLNVRIRVENDAGRIKDVVI